MFIGLIIAGIGVLLMGPAVRRATHMPEGASKADRQRLWRQGTILLVVAIVLAFTGAVIVASSV